MGTREANEVRYLRFQDRTLIGEERHLQSFAQFYSRRQRMRAPDVEPSALEQDRMMTFPESESPVVLNVLIDDWKQWYSSDIQQKLRELSVLLRRFHGEHPDSNGELRIARVDTPAFRLAEPADWAIEGWADLDISWTSTLRNSVNDEFEIMLTDVLHGQSISRVRIVPSGTMEIVPVH